MTSILRAKLLIKGRVQGVFYRQSMKNEAHNLALTGYVKNLPDGSVEAEISGPKEKIELLLKWCRQGPPYARVEEVELDWLDSDQNPHAQVFEIR